MHGVPQPPLTSRAEPDRLTVPNDTAPGGTVANQWDISVLMSVPDLSEERPVTQTPNEPKQHDTPRPPYGLPSRKFKLAVPPVATLGGLIGVAIVLVLVLLSRGSDESTNNPPEDLTDSSAEVLGKHPTNSQSTQPAGKAQMARLGLEDSPHDASKSVRAEGKKKSPYLPVVDSSVQKESSPASPQPGKHPQITKPIITQQGQYPQTDTPWPIYLEAKRPDRSATRPPVELKGTIANPNFRARNDSQRSRVH